MDGVRWDELSPQERLIAEQAVLNFRELTAACDAAADGTVLDACEALAMQQGRALIRKSIETTMSLQAERVEKKRRRSGPAAAD